MFGSVRAMSKAAGFLDIWKPGKELRFTLEPIANAGDQKDMLPETLAQDREAAGRYFSDIVAIASSFDADPSSATDNYPFVSKKRLSAIGDAYRSCRQRVADDKVKCEYLVHRLASHRALK